MRKRRKGATRPSSDERLTVKITRGVAKRRYRDERGEIEVELQLALAEREVMLAEAYGEVSAEPPF